MLGPKAIPSPSKVKLLKGKLTPNEWVSFLLDGLVSQVVICVAY